MPQKIEISPKTILLVIVVLLSLWFVYLIKDILFLLFIAFIVMSALRPIIDRMEKAGVPRALGILTAYIILIGLVIIYSSFVFPPLVNETFRLVNTLPQLVERLPGYIRVNPDTLISQIAPLGQNVARFTVGIFSNILSILTILVFAFYFLLERNNVGKFLETFLGKLLGKRVVTIIDRSEGRMGAWVRGQLLLMFIVGQASYIGLVLLGVNYALPLALIAGVLEFFPIIGPNISAIPAILVALLTSPGQALAVAILYLIVQQLENNLIVPTVMKKTVGLPPLASLTALMIGGKLFGILGVILAVPVVLVLQTVIKVMLESRNKIKIDQ